MQNFRNLLIDDHIAENYPNAKIVNYDDKDSGLSYYTAEELHDVDADWFPLCCFRDKDSGKLIYGGKDKIIHTYTNGETGSGKTTRYVMQSVRALSCLKNKPSFVIVDIHGEIIENLYKHLKGEGYKIKILNCDDPSHSDTYNPLATLAADCKKSRKLSHDTVDAIRRISEVIQPIESDRDPIWDRGALSYTNGLILDKFEDLVEDNIPIESVNMYNIFQNHYWLRSELNQNYCGSNLARIPHYGKKGHRRLSVQKLIGVTDNAEKTRASYFGVVENHFDVYGQPSFYMLSSSNSIDVEEFINEPTVIVIQSGDSVTGDTLVAMLMNDIYSKVVKMGRMNADKTLPRKIHCFLDEFANCNIAEGKEFIRMLTTSRKFGMLWHLMLQCDVQLERKYDREIGKIIRANCTEIFIGTNDYETALRFADSCGKKTIESMKSRMMNELPNLETVNLMTTEKLNLTPTGHMYIKCNRSPLLYSYFEAFYNCPEFEKLDNIIDAYPVNNFDYTETLFFPTDIPNDVNDDEYRLIKFIQEVNPTPKQIKDSFPSQSTTPMMRSLVNSKIVSYNINKEVYVLRISDKAMKLLDEKHRNIVFDVADLINVESTASNAENKKTAPAAKAGAGVRDNTNNDIFFGTMETSDPFEDDNDENSYEDHEDFNPDLDISEDPFIKEIRAKERAERRKAESNRFIVAMEKHLKNAETPILLEEYENFTSVPMILSVLIKCIRDETLERDFEEDFPRNEKIIKFEIIEQYIKENDFKSKEEWDKHIIAECEEIRRKALFPEEIMEAFDLAAIEISEELTLDNIFEIQRIIRGS